MIFPTLSGRVSGYVNLNLYAHGWLKRNGYSGAHSEIGYPVVCPLLDPVVCQDMVLECHAKLGLDFSYGGWLEDRSVLWKGSYLKDDNRYIHLGLDVNAPAGTPVALDMPGRLAHVERYHSLAQGWGTRVMIKLDDAPIVLMYAHLANVKHEAGDALKRGDIFAEVGSSDLNGVWYTHVHVQAMTLAAYRHFGHFLNQPLGLDGYGKEEDIPQLAALFPDPMNFIELR